MVSRRARSQKQHASASAVRGKRGKWHLRRGGDGRAAQIREYPLYRWISSNRGFSKNSSGRGRSLGLPAAGAAITTRQSRFDANKLPATPLAMISAASDPGADAFSFQLLAALTPSSGGRVRERLVEKSM